MSLQFLDKRIFPDDIIINDVKAPGVRDSLGADDLFDKA
jgi:hypothetical protein